MHFFVQITNAYVYHQFNMFNNRIYNLADPTDATDRVNLRTLNKYNIKPSDDTNRFDISWTLQMVFYNGLIY